MRVNESIFKIDGDKNKMRGVIWKIQNINWNYSSNWRSELSFHKIKIFFGLKSFSNCTLVTEFDLH